jgi:hypothetical protein
MTYILKRANSDMEDVYMNIKQFLFKGPNLLFNSMYQHYKTELLTDSRNYLWQYEAREYN